MLDTQMKKISYDEKLQETVERKKKILNSIQQRQ